MVPSPNLAARPGSKRFWRSIQILSILLACHAIACRDSDPYPELLSPNLLFITIDTLRADHTSLLGYPQNTTPNLSRIAAEGASFSSAFAAIATTGPSHASMFTGLYPISHGVLWNGMRLSHEHVTLAEVLQGAGYQTAAFVSSFPLHERWGYRQGFAIYADDFSLADSSMQLEEWNGEEIEDGFDRRAGRTSDQAIEWLETSRKSTSPFFLFVHYFDPHYPFTPPASTRGSMRPLSSSRLDGNIAAYDEEIAYTDQALGRLVDTLDSLDIAEDTLVVITADHGEGLMQHGAMGHGIHLYDEAVHVPLVFRWKEVIEAGVVFSSPVELVDLLPTLIELVGVESRVGSQGRSLAGVLKGRERLDPLRPVFLHRRRYRPRMVEGVKVAGERWALRHQGWKFITGNEHEEAELYQLAIDSKERTNVIENNPDVAAKMQAMIDAWKLASRSDTKTSHDLSDEERARLEALGYVE